MITKYKTWFSHPVINRIVNSSQKKTTEKKIYQKSYVRNCIQIVCDYFEAKGPKSKAIVLKIIFNGPAILSDRLLRVLDGSLNLLEVSEMLANEDQDKNFNEKESMLKNDSPSIVSKERLAAKKAKKYLFEVSEMLANDDQKEKDNLPMPNLVTIKLNPKKDESMNENNPSAIVSTKDFM